MLTLFQVISKPYLVFFNLEKCIDPLVPINGCPTPQVCVEQCPTSLFIYDRNACSANTLETIKSKLICNRNVDVRTIQNCNQLDVLITDDYCAKWYLPSESCEFKFKKKVFFKLLYRSCFRNIFGFLSSHVVRGL